MTQEIKFGTGRWFGATAYMGGQPYLITGRGESPQGPLFQLVSHRAEESNGRDPFMHIRNPEVFEWSPQTEDGFVAAMACRTWSELLPYFEDGTWYVIDKEGNVLPDEDVRAKLSIQWDPAPWEHRFDPAWYGPQGETPYNDPFYDRALQRSEMQVLPSDGPPLNDQGVLPKTVQVQYEPSQMIQSAETRIPFIYSPQADVLFEGIPNTYHADGLIEAADKIASSAGIDIWDALYGEVWASPDGSDGRVVFQAGAPEIGIEAIGRVAREYQMPVYDINDMRVGHATQEDWALDQAALYAKAHTPENGDHWEFFDVPSSEDLLARKIAEAFQAKIAYDGGEGVSDRDDSQDPIKCPKCDSHSHDVLEVDDDGDTQMRCRSCGNSYTYKGIPNHRETKVGYGEQPMGMPATPLDPTPQEIRCPKCGIDPSQGQCPNPVNCGMGSATAIPGQTSPLDVPTFSATKEACEGCPACEGNCGPDCDCKKCSCGGDCGCGDKMGAFNSSDGSPLEEGKWYTLRSKKYRVPDIVQVVTMTPDTVVATVEGDNESIFPIRVSLDDVEKEGYMFEPYHEQPGLATTGGIWKEARRDFTAQEQQELIEEEGVARNKHKLNLEGTHYRQDIDELDITRIFLW